MLENMQRHVRENRIRLNHTALKKVFVTSWYIEEYYLFLLLSAMFIYNNKSVVC